mgnify:CR=1 FL=1
MSSIARLVAIAAEGKEFADWDVSLKETNAVLTVMCSRVDKFFKYILIPINSTSRVLKFRNANRRTL